MSSVLDSVTARRYDACPVCGSAKISEQFDCQDYTVSGEHFSVWECADCELRFTQAVPEEAHIAAYYKSEEYISHSNTKRGLMNQLYQWVRSYTIRKKVALIKSLSGKAAGSILDIGCGTGEFLAGMKQAGWQVQGLEPDDGARQQARQLTGTDVQHPDAIFSLDKTFDAITMWHVLEHVHQLHENVARIHELLKSDGVLLVAVPNYTSVDAGHYQQHWAAYDVPRHLYHFSPQSMARLMAGHGFHVEAHLPMPFDAFYVSMLSERYRHGQNRLPVAFWHGFKSWNHARRRVQEGSSVLYVIRKQSLDQS